MLSLIVAICFRKNSKEHKATRIPNRNQFETVVASASGRPAIGVSPRPPRTNAVFDSHGPINRAFEGG
jgi:hypothetical protein